MSSYTQQYLAESLLQCSYNAHDAVEDVLILQKLVSSIPFSYEKSKHATFSLTSALETFDYQKRVKKHFPSFQHLVDNRVLSQSMARKIAGSGLNFHHLELAHRRNPDGIRILFAEMHDGK